MFSVSAVTSAANRISIISIKTGTGKNMAPTKNLPPPTEKDPLWYKKAVIYQAHVRSFCDSDANGIGDFRGLTSKLDYLQDLGITAIWLLPFYPSPLRDEGYDIADYSAVNPIYGELSDFKEFLREAHKRGLRVITELVINHTSDQHDWFQKSRRAKPGSKWRDFYVWSDSQEKYKEARIIFKDFELSNWTWDPVAKSNYWHRFYSHQPDLNFDNPEVHKEIFRVFDFWLDLGVDGMRLDAVPYLYEREGTNCENLPETHAFLKKLRTHMDTKYGDRMLLAEANQWPEDSAAYFGQGKGDECHVAFHFPLMPRLFMAVRMEDRTPIVDILEQTPAIPETSQWAIFLRNHDELTLEMVTDEERDYMYRVYAQDSRARINLGIRRRLAPLLGNDRKRIELLNALLLSMPGTPVLYYGDEIGLGDNVFLGDRNGVRTPMQWSSDKNAGFSRANPQSLFLPIILDPEYHYEAVNVENQQHNLHSLLWWMKRLLALRKRWPVFGLGSIEFLQPDNRKILAFVRKHGNETVLVVCNLSRFVQAVELNLSAYQQLVPVEMFSRNAFPPILDKPYFLTIGPHAFYWFALEQRSSEAPAVAAAPIAIPEIPRLEVAEDWHEVLEEQSLRRLEIVLQDYIPPRRWFGGKTRIIKNVHVSERFAVSANGQKSFLLLVDLDYVQGDPERYLLPLAFAAADEAAKLQLERPHLIIARLFLRDTGVEGFIYDAVGSRAFAQSLLDTMGRRRVLKGTNGEVKGFSLDAFRRLHDEDAPPLEPLLGRAEQSNSAILFGDKFILKTFRRLESGVNPDLEINRFLAKNEFPHVPPMAGGLTYRAKDGKEISLAILSGFAANCKDAWEFTLDTLGRYYERVGSLPEEQRTAPKIEGQPLDAVAAELPDMVAERLGTYVESARLLGERTAAMHLCLACDKDDKEFAPEPFNPFYQRSLFQSMRNLAVENLGLLKRGLKTVPESVRAEAEKVAALEPEILKRLRTVADMRITGMRLRVHGDYHLGQVLHTGKDFLIIDFEGEPARALSERRIKRTPLRDVAGMLRSFDYAAHAALFAQLERGVITQEALKWIEPWARYWTHWTSVVFLQAYLAGAESGGFLPKTTQELKTLLEANEINKALYELGYELNNRPAWLRIPLQGILQLMEGQK
jgi:maltose alpha-D-glucosyltransferase/alpha-amylase